MDGSAAGDIDYWTIVDTGSTDGTQDTIDAAMAGLPGQRLAQEFVDFSTTRNWALRVCYRGTTTDTGHSCGLRCISAWLGMQCKKDYVLITPHWVPAYCKLQSFCLSNTTTNS